MTTSQVQVRVSTPKQGQSYTMTKVSEGDFPNQILIELPWYKNWLVFETEHILSAYFM